MRDDEAGGGEGGEERDGGTGPGEAVTASLPAVVRAGCLTLTVLGALSVVLIGSTVLRPDPVRCSLARALIEDANGDDEDFNDVDTGERDVAGLECEEAIRLAGGIPESADGDETLSVPSASTIRVRAGLATLVGAAQAVTGYLTLRTGRRQLRNSALVFTLTGAFFPVLGLLTVAPLVFVAYAIGISPASQEIWPRRGRRR